MDSPAVEDLASTRICGGAMLRVGRHGHLVPERHRTWPACRCILGIFEASFDAGAPYYLSLFYQRRELAFRALVLLGMPPLANCFAGALAYSITHIKHSIAPWKLLFI